MKLGRFETNGRLSILLDTAFGMRRLSSPVRTFHMHVDGWEFDEARRRLEPDGYIAGPKGEADWIIMDPEVDFGAYFEQFDTFLLGRRTFEAMGRAGQGRAPGTETLVFSRTLRQEDYPGVTIVAGGAEEMVAALRAAPGKDIWLFGGGSLFRSLLGARLVDTVEIGVTPVLLGGGVPLLAARPRRRS